MRSYEGALARAERAEAELAKERRTVASLATMLGWDNVPPQEVLERSLSAVKAELAAARERVRELEEELIDARGSEEL